MNQVSETTKTHFFYQLREYGIDRIIISWDFAIATLTFIVIFFDRFDNWGIFLKPTPEHVGGIFAVAATFFAVTLASLAIILSFSTNKFISFLREHGKLSSILFLFWLGNISYLITVAFALIFLIISDTHSVLLQQYIYPLVVATFVYALLNTFYLLGTIIRFGYFLDFFQREKGE